MATPPVIPVRFERTTHSLEGCCSIQLSYGTIADCKYTKIIDIYSFFRKSSASLFLRPGRIEQIQLY